jgi:hydroxypyruvate reductase
MIEKHTLTAARALGIDALDALKNNDAHSCFKSLDTQVITGPTLTNVNDFRAILIHKA